MLRLLKYILRGLQGGTIRLLLMAGGVLLVWGMFAPVGTLVWWLRQNPKSLGSSQPSASTSGNQTRNLTADTQIDCYIVFFTGVGDFSADQLTPGEQHFLHQLTQKHPDCVAVSDVFPYSAANENLGGHRLLAPLWRAAEHGQGWLKNADVLIKIRNLWRFAISIDGRYGPVYNQGIADAVINRMNAAHPIDGDRPFKVILIGTSGGAQVALGAVHYLAQWLPHARLVAVSVGGDFAGTNDFKVLEHLYHLEGQGDWIADLSRVLLPSRWPWVVGSSFNQFRRQGHYTASNSGPHEHDGPQGYFGLDRVGKSGTTYVDLTIQKVNQLPIWSN
jgi:hypothetical protein